MPRTADVIKPSSSPSDTSQSYPVNGVRVSIDLWEEGFEMFACDDAAGVREVVSHLIEVHGCTDIAFLTGPKEHPHSGNRLLGYRQAMAQAGLSVRAYHN